MKTRLLISLTLFISISLSAQNFSVYVSDAGNFNTGPWQIMKVDSAGENAETFIDTDDLNWPQDILFMEDSNIVLISNLGSNKISRHNATTGEYISDFATGINGPTRMKIGHDGFLYVLQWNGVGKVKRYNMDGSYHDDFTDVGISTSIGLDWDADTNLYVSTYGGDKVYKFDTEGNSLGVFIDTNLLGPTNIWFDSNGDLLVSDYNGTAVKRYDSEGNFVEDFLSGLSASEGVAYMDDGSILIGNGGNSSVKRFSADGDYIEDFVASGLNGLLNPNAVVIRYESTTSITEYEVNKDPMLINTSGRIMKLEEASLMNLRFALLLDSNGKQVYSWKNPPMNLSLYHLPEGMYIFKAVFRNGESRSERFVVRD